MTSKSKTTKIWYLRAPFYEWGLTLTFCFGAFLLAARHDYLEGMVAYARQHENLELDEIFVVALVLIVSLFWQLSRRWRKARDLAGRLREKNTELENALKEVTQLRSMIPMCAWCRKVRNDQGYWQQVESYLEDHASVKFTHGMCPSCYEKALKEAEGELSA